MENETSVQYAVCRSDERTIMRAPSAGTHPPISLWHQITHDEITFGFIMCHRDNKAEIGVPFRPINSKAVSHCAAKFSEVPRVHVHTYIRTHTHTGGESFTKADQSIVTTEYGSAVV